MSPSGKHEAEAEAESRGAVGAAKDTPQRRLGVGGPDSARGTSSRAEVRHLASLRLVPHCRLHAAQIYIVQLI